MNMINLCKQIIIPFGINSLHIKYLTIQSNQGCQVSHVSKEKARVCFFGVT